MSRRVVKRMLAVGFAVAAAGVSTAGDVPAGRDLVINAPGEAIRVRIVTTIDGKSVEERRAAWVESLVAQADADGDGRIIAAEWEKVAASAGSMISPDFAGEDGLTKDQLAAVLSQTVLGAPTEVVVQPLPLVDRLELFSALDADGDGFITADELDEAERLFARYDADGDRTLNQPELAPTEPLQPSPVRSGENFPPGRFPFHWEEPAGKPTAVVEIKLIGRAFGRPKVEVRETGEGERREIGGQTDSRPSPTSPDPPFSRLSITSETRKASFDVAGMGLDLDATPSRITSEDVKRFFLQQFIQRDADKNGYLEEAEFLGLGLPGLDFKTADVNGDGMLYRDEIRGRLEALVSRETSRVRVEATYERQPLFTKLDADGDGRLSRRELRGAGDSLASIDVDGDGRVGLAEFGGRYRLSFSVPNLLDGANPRMVAAFEAMPRGPSARAGEGPSWFAAMDRNADGDLDRREFLGTAATFAKLDADSDGLLAPDEATAAEEMVFESE